MPKLTVENLGTFDVPQGKRLVLALIDECGVDQLHACGGKAKCTTCRVQFISGEPAQMAQAERDALIVKGHIATPGVRLSCQMKCDHDMEVRILARLAGSGRVDSGKRPELQIEPPPVWIDAPATG